MRGVCALLLLGLAAASPWGCASGGARPPSERAPVRGVPRPVSGQILVTVPETTAWGAVVQELGSSFGLQTIASWPMKALGLQCVLFQVPDSRSAQSVVRSLAAHPRVELAQLNQVFTVLGDAAVPGYDDAYAGLQYAPQRLGLATAHGWSTGEGVDVAVVDTGVDVTHPELLERVSVARNFVRQDAEEFTGDRHGTATAGVIAAAAGNGLGIVGVAPGARLRALKACWYAQGGGRRAVCTTYTLAQALDYGVSEGADILNLSLGGPRDPLLERLIAAAVERGILVVAAHGGDDADFPARLEGVVGVRASDADGAVWPDRAAPAVAGDALFAPGVEILSLAPERSYDFFSGSSIAAAHVTGVAALLLARRPDLTPAEVSRLLRETAVAREGGPPVVNACAALARLLGRTCS